MGRQGERDWDKEESDYEEESDYVEKDELSWLST